MYCYNVSFLREVRSKAFITDFTIKSFPLFFIFGLYINLTSCISLSFCTTITTRQSLCPNISFISWFCLSLSIQCARYCLCCYFFTRFSVCIAILSGAPFTSGSTVARAPLEILRNDPHKYNLSKYPNFIGNLNILVLNYFMSYVMTWIVNKWAFVIET